jgi:hypothetical protein
MLKNIGPCIGPRASLSSRDCPRTPTNSFIQAYELSKIYGLRAVPHYWLLITPLMPGSLTCTRLAQDFR